ncbi:DZIP3 ligase, partial [Passerina amoena]|nr:DZIP3 ligase [Passerina amoena]
ESQCKLQSVRERFRRRADQSLLLWLYECWFAGAHVDVWLDSSEAQQLGCLSQDVAIDRGLGRRPGRHSLWRRLVGSAFIWDYTVKPSSCVEAQPREQAAYGDDPCTICHEELGRSSCELECGHEFHRECIRTWLLEHSSTCPICREHAALPADSPAQNHSRPCKRSGI